MSTELPPLPPMDITEKECGWGEVPEPDAPDVPVGHSDAQMLAYGQQCRDAALLEAAELCEQEALQQRKQQITLVDVAAMLRAKVGKK